MAKLHRRQAPGREIHKHFSLAPARSHTMTASNKANAMTASNKASASSKASATTHSEQTQTVKGRRGEGSGTQCMRTLPFPPRPPVHHRNNKQQSKRKQQSKLLPTEREKAGTPPRAATHGLLATTARRIRRSTFASKSEVAWSPKRDKPTSTAQNGTNETNVGSKNALTEFAVR